MPAMKCQDTRGSPSDRKAVLFADVCGSTSLYEMLGDQRAFAAISERLDMLRKLVFENHGTVVKNMGDEIMCIFWDAVSATQAACEMQAAIGACPAADGISVGIRIGFHCGQVLQRENDIFGDTVNMAARMAGIAQAGQIITTADTASMLPSIMRTSLRGLSTLPVKGKKGGVEICEVLWQESDDMTVMAGNTHHPGADASSLMLVHRGERFVVSAASPVITLGRDEQADIVTGNPHASRMHARIERRQDKYALIDMSSNGSYVAIREETEVRLRREEMLLRERGTISMGHPHAKSPMDSIEFFLMGG